MRNASLKSPISGDLWICVALFLSTFFIYSPVRDFDFVSYDDPQIVEHPQAIRGFTPAGLVWAFTSGEAANWFPVTRLSHMLDFQLFGSQAGWHHLTNLLLHALAALCLFTFLERATAARWRSALVAFLFALHPLHVESVAWVSERKDVLSAFFWFVTLLAYVRYCERPGWARYLGVLTPFCLGSMSKPMMVTLPFVLLLLDVWPLRRIQLMKVQKALWEKVPFFVISAVIALVTYLVQKRGGATTMLHIPFGLRLENALVSYVVYVAKMFWPSRLAVLYPYPASIPVWKVVGAGVGIIIISSLILRTSRTRPYLAVGWFWFLGTLAPVIGLVQVGLQARADRYTYIPMVGLSIVLAWGMADLTPRWPQARPALLSLVAAGCSVMIAVTWVQVQYWKNNESLYRHAIEVTDANYLMHYNLGVALAKSPGRAAEAIPEFKTALRINPDYVEAHVDLGAVLADMPGGLPEAIAEYELALRIKPDSAEAHHNLGNALAKIPGRGADAIQQYETALRINPADTDARTNLAVAMTQRPGHLTEAISEYQAALQINPDSAEAHSNLGAALVLIPGRLPEAIHEYEEAVRIHPAFAEAHYNLGTALAKIPGRLTDAIAQYQIAIRIRPDYAEAHANLGVALAQTPGRLPEAISEFQTVVRLTPDSAKAHSNLAVVLAQTPGRMPEAIAEFEASYRLSPDPLIRKQLDRFHQTKRSP